jgi:hypothetical protein
MPYVINPVVTINSVDYAGDALNGVTATAGRATVDEQPRAGYCNIRLIEFDTTTNSIEIDQEIQIRVDDSSGNDQILWTGWVSDVTRTIQSFGQTGYVTQVTVTGVGSLAKLNRRLVGGSGFSKEFDGDRILAILKETAGETWAEVTGTLDWQNVDPLTTWAAYDILIGNIDTPGDFELKAYSSGATNGLTLAQTMASSGLGLLYECNCGRINYDSFSARLDRVALNGFLNLDADAILAAGLTSTSRLNDLVNSVEITYKNGQTESGTDTTSIAIYGEFGAAISTELENAADATQRVNYYLDTRSFPRTSITGVNLVLSTDTIADALRDDLLGLYVGLPVGISDLPPNIYDAAFTGFVEGYTWQINRNELFLSLNVSDYSLSQIEMNWLQVPASETWNTITPTLDWENARSVS